MADRNNPHAQESPQETRSELKNLATDAEEVIYHADSVFPFQLFPDSLTVDRVKVTITRRAFFRVSEIISIGIGDILNVEGDTGPFFGSIRLYTRFFADKPLEIKNLTRKDAISIKAILQGYVIARQENIDCSTVDVKELKALLWRLGSASTNLR